MYPADFALPMAAPRDLGKAAVDRLVAGIDDVGVRYLEGPERYSAADVANAFARGLGRSVTVDVVPRENWRKEFEALGFSEAAAASYTRVTEVRLDSGFDLGDAPIRGTISLEGYVRELIERA